MAIRSEWVAFGEQAIPGLLSHPDRARLPLPAVLVIQEAWGVDDALADVARRFAAAGYASFAPDLYWQPGGRPEPLRPDRIAALLEFLNALPPPSWHDAAARNAALACLAEPARRRVGETFAAIFGGPAGSGMLRPDQHVPRLLAATRHLRAECAATRGQHIVSVGYCLGGALSALLACHDAELAGAIVYYGSSPPAELVPKITCPMLGFYGALDLRITPGVTPFSEAMTRAGKRFESVVFEGAGHAFFNDSRPSYDVRAARLAFARTVEFLRDRLA